MGDAWFDSLLEYLLFWVSLSPSMTMGGRTTEVVGDDIHKQQYKVKITALWDVNPCNMADRY
jgi:hypothetical protein